MRWDKHLPLLEWTVPRFREIIERKGMSGVEISVSARALSPEEAIGKPDRLDFPILAGVERVIEASVLGTRGHAFTDSPSEFRGTLGEVLNLDMTMPRNRAVYTATLNATLGHVGVVKRTVHCKDNDPEKCAKEIANHMLNLHGVRNIGLIGLNPAIAEGLVRAFGKNNIKITDRDPDTIGKRKFDVEVWDGDSRTADLVDFADMVLVTGTTLVNGTFDKIWGRINSAGKKCVLYGITGAGVCELAGLERLCFYAQEG